MYRSNWERLSKTRYTQFAQFSRTVVILPLSAHPYLSDAKLPRFFCALMVGHRVVHDSKRLQHVHATQPRETKSASAASPKPNS